MKSASLKYSWDVTRFYDAGYYSLFHHFCSWSVFIITLAIYLSTIDHSASYWDCPEYITCASRLEVGHPPGNPVWMLAMRVATIPFPPHMHALVINAGSAVCMALAAFFLSKTAFVLSMMICRNIFHANPKIKITDMLPVPVVASYLAGGSFAFCDSAWFSAVEAEVYAMSAFLTSLSLWLMIKWARQHDRRKQDRLLILVAYITGLSLGVHQLNLLCIPVFALIFTFRRHHRHATRHAWTAIFLSFGIIALILIGMMKGSLEWAMRLELFFVNRLHLPFFSGTIAYPVLLIVIFSAAAYLTQRAGRAAIASIMFLCLWMSGMFVFAGNLTVAAILSATASAAIIWLLRLPRTTILTINWMTAFILLGYSSFALILIRGYASPPMNEATPTDIFALSSYISREQYGSKPLLYGATPYSRPLLHEDWIPGDSTPRYSRYVLRKTGVTRTPFMPGAHLCHRSGMLTGQDSAANDAVIRNNTDGYLISDYTYSRVTTPELDMFMPRITGASASDLDSYSDWVGMDPQTMSRVKISEAIDSSGAHVGKLLPDGSREEKYSLRPTYMQNLRMFVSYQAYYMYLRYLLWNFVGRQNDIHSTGEIEHGNFITGLPLIDNAMLGDQSLMPEYAGGGNPGRNVYYGIPFIFGLIGIVYLFRCGRNGKRIQAVVTLMFLMTGIAIVVYLNQTPGEARERDYSFLGSFMAFSLWIAFGGMAIALGLLKATRIPELLRIAVTFIIGFIPSSVLLIENFDDHQRSGRSEPLDFSRNILEMQRPSIIFTHGDNDTFPLWYASETEGIGKQHTVIDMSYLATPGYVVNLLKQGGNVLTLTATPADIAYNAYAFTKIAPDADTVPVCLIDALKELYSQKSGSPVMRHSRVTIPGRQATDTLTINLRDIASGGSVIPFRTLMLLDIIATNNASDKPKPLHFLFPVKRQHYSMVVPALRQGIYSYVYDPLSTDSSFVAGLKKDIRPIMSHLSRKTGEPYYIDQLIADRMRRQRGALITTASSLLRNGELLTPLLIKEMIAQCYPYSYIPAASFTLADSTFHEGIEYGKLTLSIRDSLYSHANRMDHDATVHRLDQTPPDDDVWRTYCVLTYDAMVHLDYILGQAREWQTYYKSLSPRQKNTVSTSTLRIISTIPVMEKIMERENIIFSNKINELKNRKNRKSE